MKAVDVYTYMYFVADKLDFDWSTVLTSETSRIPPQVLSPKTSSMLWSCPSCFAIRMSDMSLPPLLARWPITVAVKVVAGAAEADMREAMWYKREFICENRVRYPVTLGVVDVDVRLQPAAQPAARPLDPAAAESGVADRHPSLACRPAACVCGCV
jgi:hypothetical protein